MNKEILEKLIDEKLSIKKIALKLNVSYSSVRYYVKKYNREPEFSKFTTNTPDKIYSTILYFSIVILPFLIDEITKKLLNILKIKL